MSAIAISLASLCEKAGNPGNQDNLWICPDLSRSGTPASNDDEVYPLSSYGAIMAVASPLSPGQPGEDACRVAINTLYSGFTFIPSRVTRSDAAIRDFLAGAVDAAFNAVHVHCDDTCNIVVAWLVKGRLHVAWSRDARAYLFNPANGLTRLTHDYSCDRDDDNALLFDIHTYPVHRNDVVMICSDDVTRELTDETLRKLLAKTPSLVESLDIVWRRLTGNGEVVEDATVALMRLASAPNLPPVTPKGWDMLYGTPQQETVVTRPPQPDTLPSIEETTGDNEHNDDNEEDDGISIRSIVLGALVAILLVGAGISVWYFNFRSSGDTDPQLATNDSIASPDALSLAALVPLDSIKLPQVRPDTVTVDTVTPAPATTASSATYTAASDFDNYVAPASDDDNVYDEVPMQQTTHQAPRTLDPHSNFDPNNGDPAAD